MRSAATTVPLLVRPSKRPLGLIAGPLYRVTMLAPVGEPCMASTIQQADSNECRRCVYATVGTASKCVKLSVSAAASVWNRAQPEATQSQLHALAALGSIARGHAQRRTATATSQRFLVAGSHLSHSNSGTPSAAGHTSSHRCHTPAGPAAHMFCWRCSRSAR